MGSGARAVLSRFSGKRMQKMSWDGRVRRFYKHNSRLLKVSISTLAIFLFFKVTFYRPAAMLESPDSGDPSNSRKHAQTPLQGSGGVFDGFEFGTLLSSSFSHFSAIQDGEKCDLFRGDWVPKQSGPYYTNETCSFIASHQNCMTNGRPDEGYLYWKWSPKKCQLPEFDPHRFLDTMRNKSWALVGDSISRNHVQSLLCMLSKVEEAIEIYHDEGYKSRTWTFPSYNLNISVIWSPFLVEAAIFDDVVNAPSTATSEVELHLDRIDSKWKQQYHDWNYMIFSTGKWFLRSAIYYENGGISGCHECPKRNLTELGFDYAYRKALRSAFEFIGRSNHKGSVFFRTSTPDHFEGGSWDEGGGCNRTMPSKEGEIGINDLHKILRRIELEELERGKIVARENGVNLKLIDLFPMSLLRPDGHPGPYRFYHPLENKNDNQPKDCLHWCLPGPIDAWNDVIMGMVMNG